MLELQKFIMEHQNWEELLMTDPYWLKIKTDENFPNMYLFIYDTINSDFSEPIVKEARGIILKINEKTNVPEVVCHPFDKFFNYGESNAVEIDWSTARVQEKIDGSIVKLWYSKTKKEWVLSSNSCIDAKNALLSSGFTIKKLFTLALMEYYCKTIDDFVNKYGLNRNCTYIFELISPYNQVVIKYPTTRIFHIGTRNNTTGREKNEDIGIRKPKEYLLRTLNECVRAADLLNSSKEVEYEGFVVVDNSWNRVKIKSPMYVAIHHMSNGLTYQNIVKIIRDGEVSEVIGYYPKYEAKIKYIEELYLDYRLKLINKCQIAKKWYLQNNPSHKEYAQKWKKLFPECFWFLDHNWAGVDEYLNQLTEIQVLRKLKID